MKCPECRGRTLVTDTRNFENYKRRSRVCVKCQYRFTSYELVLSRKYVPKPQGKIIRDSRKGWQIDEAAYLRREAIQEANQTGETVQQVLERWDRELEESDRRTA